ncbi:hypothetical protein G7054_g13946 [Neopestalotiopsis clavispora]|nr:hypothetical protein G7054_g13946 [Neopestalotiopsis clavispora]
MSVAQAAYGAEKLVGHDDSSIIKQDVADYQETGDTSSTMKALVWLGKNKVAVQDVPRPKIIEDGDVILKVTGSTVCGSDLHLLHGAVIELNKGDILGHEFCGIVDEVGPAVTKCKRGRRYVASFQIACGDCFFCKQKLSSQCEKTNANQAAKSMYGAQTAGMFGYSHFTGGFAGGQAEYVRVPLGDVNLLEIPEGVPDEKALYLSDVLPTAYNCAHDTAIYEGDHVAVFGAGPIGQMAGVFAANAGAAKVIYVDTEPRLSVIKERWPSRHAGKIEVVDYKALSFGVTTQDTVITRLKQMCGGRGPDVALECAAGEYAKGWLHWLEMLAGARRTLARFSTKWSRVCGIMVGVVSRTNHFNIGSVMQRGIRLIGNGQAPVHKYWEDLLESIKTGELDPLQMVSHRYRIEDIDKVYYAFEKKQDGIQKVFIETKFSLPACEGSPKLSSI